jgi:hypothetical protein
MWMPTPVKRAYRTFRWIFRREPWIFEVLFGVATAMFFFLQWLDWKGGPPFGSLLVLSSVQPEAFWQWAGLLGGTLQSGMALTSHSGERMKHCGKWIRWLTAGLLACLWGSMTCGSLIATPWNPTAAIYLACSIGNVYVALHVLWEEEYSIRLATRKDV